MMGWWSAAFMLTAGADPGDALQGVDLPVVDVPVQDSPSTPCALRITRQGQSSLHPSGCTGSVSVVADRGAAVKAVLRAIEEYGAAPLVVRPKGADDQTATLWLIGGTPPLGTPEFTLDGQRFETSLGEVDRGLVADLGPSALTWLAERDAAAQQRVALSIKAQPTVRVDTLARFLGAVGPLRPVYLSEARSAAEVLSILQGPGPIDGIQGSGLGSGEAPRTPSVTSDRQQSIMGSLTMEQLDPAIRSHGPQFERCYAKALADTPDLQGTMTVKFVVAGDGSVESSRWASGTLGASPVRHCVTGHFMRIRFPESVDGSRTIVRWTFSFSST